MKEFRKMVCVLLVVCIVFTMPAFAATESYEKQIVEKENLESLIPTQSKDIYQTVDGEYLMKADGGNYILLERSSVSFKNKELLQTQLQALDIPDELKQHIIDKYNYYKEHGDPQDIEVSIYRGMNKIDSNGRSVVDGLPDIHYDGRILRCYTVTYDNIPIRETIKSGSRVRSFLENTSSIALTVFGMTDVKVLTLVSTVGGVVMTFLDLLESLSGSVSGSAEDALWIDGRYTSLENHYYIWSDVLESWNKALTTQIVDVDKLALTSHTLCETSPNYFKMIDTELKTLENLSYFTESYANPLPVAVQYQFLGKTERISIEVEGVRIAF